MTIRKIENARQEECDYINYTIYVSLFSDDRTHKVNCHLSFVITKLSLTFPKISRHIRRLKLNNWSGVFLMR